MPAPLPQKTELGNLSLVEVLFYYDGPGLIAACDEEGQYYIAASIELSPTDEKWLYAPLQIELLEDARTGRIELRSAFQQPQPHKAFVVTTPFGRGSDKVERLTEGIPEAYLPESGARLALEPRFYCKDEYSLRIDFAKGGSARRIFQSMSYFLEGLHSLASHVCGSLGVGVRPLINLAGITSQSLGADLVTRLTIDPERQRRNSAYVHIPELLQESRKTVFRFVQENPAISSVEQLETLTRAVNDSAKRFGFLDRPEIDLPGVSSAIGSLSSGFNTLTKQDRVCYRTQSAKIEIKSPPGRIKQTEIENLILQKLFEGENPITLRVKKPDYLGNTKWEFLFGGTTLGVKIADEEWLRRFQNREIIVKPGDALKALVKEIYQEDKKGRKRASLEMLEVYDVIRPVEPKQSHLWDTTDSD